ncbi:MAG: OmpA family protein [Bacteroidota bacterium]
MRKIIYISILLIIFASSSFELFAQKYLAKADKSFQKKDYYSAILQYKEAMNKLEDSASFASIYFKIAESYRFGNYPLEAQEWYTKAINKGYKDSTVFYNMANAAFTNCNYNLAKEYFTKQLEINSNDSKTKKKLESIDFALSQNNIQPKYEASNIQVLNSKYSEYSPFIFRNKLIFASARYDEGDTKNLYKYTGQGFSDFYESQFSQKDVKWLDPKKIEGGINSKFNDGTICYDAKNNIAYFMQCNGYQGKVPNCNIYYSSFDAKENKWTEAKILECNSKIYSLGHPTISTDGNTLYFASDMPGGLGNTDIWMIKKGADNIWSNPINLGSAINTTENDMFPYLSGDSLLYFASNGHLGFGGLDIFVSSVSNNNFSTPLNIGSPFNTCSDDFGILVASKDSGMFCSNRAGGQGDDDIYMFKKIPLSLRALGTVVEKYTNNLIESAIVTLTGTDGSIDSTLSDSEGKYLFLTLKSNVDYTVTAKKVGYLVDSKSFSVATESENRDFSKSTGNNIDFELILIASQNANKNDTTLQEITIPDIYYDFDKWSLRDTSKYSLNKVIAMLNLNPEMKIRINSHTDNRGTDIYNNVLSENRAQSVVNYLIDKGIKPERLTSKGWGKSKLLVVEAKTEEEHQLNRRTTFSIMNSNELNSVYQQVEHKKIEDRIKLKNNNINSNNSEIKANETPVVLNKNLESLILSPSKPDSVIDFRVQFSASTSPLEKNFYKKLQEGITDFKIEYTKQNDGYYKYTMGSFQDIADAKKLLKRMVKFHPDCFIVAYKGNTRITADEAKRLLKK